ncbi:MAG TPA: DoxX family protein [Verrucomicrobiae bacterium]|nr:DoxX family protein [Verrucomicrobiae bacterium]
MDAFQKLFGRLDSALVKFMLNWGIKLLRSSLAVVFIWFGLLKVFKVSPVFDLVAQTVYWFPPEWFVPFLGFWETVVGLGLLFGKALRFVLLLFFMQMAGTFLVLIFHPGLSFQNGNPLHLTVLGEFVVKNLVLIAAGLVVGTTVRRK